MTDPPHGMPAVGGKGSIGEVIGTPCVVWLPPIMLVAVVWGWTTG
jgi:hypothetical protein